jgi:hypothetical protein
MLPQINTVQALTFEDIYKRYSAPLYGIILKVAKNTKEAEDILIQSFKSFIQQHAVPKDNNCIFLDLLKIAIPVASEKINLPQQNICKIIFKEFSRPGLQTKNNPYQVTL